jgi:hypothetical protein
MTAIFATLSSCYFDKGETLYPNAKNCDTTNVRYSVEIRETIDNFCIGCHNPFTLNGNVNLENYAGVKDATLNNKLVTAISYENPDPNKNMPPVSKLDPCTINRIKAWVAQGALNN